MPDYSFQSLHDRDFEELARDLLQADHGCRYETFKKGRDEGIDLRYSASVDDRGVVVQAKHWAGTGLARLRTHLRKEELPKISRLKPRRYILVTSVPLSPANKRELVEVLRGFVQSTQDIIGPEDLNNLLGMHPEVEERHFKLWVASSAVLTRVLHAGPAGRSDFEAKKIAREARRYVATEDLREALDRVRRMRFLVVKGEPGIGKTTLAKMIAYRLMGEGCHLVHVETVDDAQSLFDPGTPQVFLLDDFLGSNYIELLSPNEDSSLVSFIERVQTTDRKYLLLTSRTTILNRAVGLSEKLRHAKLDLAEHELTVGSYSDLEKARILYSHVYFSSVSDGCLRTLFHNRNHWRVINHRNFNPRVVEFLTDAYHVGDVLPADYPSYVVRSLDHPQEIWRHAYELQIDDFSRFLLSTLFSLGDRVNEGVLLEAYMARVDYEIANNNLPRPLDPFIASVRTLLGGFIKRDIADDSGDAVYSFFSPAVVDFMLERFRESADERWRVLDSCVFVQQARHRFGFMESSPVRLTGAEVARYRQFLDVRGESLRSTYGSAAVQLLLQYAANFDAQEVGPRCAGLIPSIIEELGGHDVGTVIKALMVLSENSDVKTAVTSRFEVLVRRFLSVGVDIDDLQQIKDLFGQYSVSYDDFLTDASNRAAVQEAVDEWWEAGVDELVSENDRVQEALDESDMQSALSGIVDGLREINEILKVEPSPAFDMVESYDCDDILSDNQRAYAEEMEAESHEGYARAKSNTAQDATAVNELFSEFPDRDATE